MIRVAASWGLMLLCSVPLWAQDVTIHITGPGTNAKYVRDGDAAQLPVSVAVGQTVRFANDRGTTTTHTATERDPAFPGRPALFTTGELAVGAFKDIAFDATLFSTAGGAAGGTVELNYVCTRHPGSMKSKILLTDTQPSNPGGGGTPNEPAKRRRDITKLNATELVAYQDAWRLLQQSGNFKRLAGYHGCPDGYCHRMGEDILFLAWHREYLYQLESALGKPLHYWYWNGSVAATSGIPRMFTDRTYVSGGITYPNPLLNFRFSCPVGTPATSTARRPRAPFLLTQYAASVQTAYGATTYADLTQLLESPPHDSVHGWTGGNMGAVFSAAYDPVFWAHHSNVDRQWASWQRAGGANPIATELSLPLTGFSGRTVANVVTISGLGYEYDMYDPMPVQEGIAMDTARPGNNASGIGKTFELAVDQERTPAAQAGPQTLVVSGLAKHPRDSYFVYVFVNKPDAKIEDASADNPNFAGTFAIFGGAGESGDHERVAAPVDRPVMELFAGKKSTDQAIRQVTLITTDEEGNVVASEVVPFSAVRLEASRLPAAGARAAAERPVGSGEAQARLFTGQSNSESFDEAYQDAMTKAQDALTSGADRIIKSKLVSVEGQRGGITGRTALKVTIRAWLE